MREHVKRRVGILSQLLHNGNSVLDVGCGVGSYITKQIGYLPVRIVAIDRDERSIKYANENNRYKNIIFKVGVGETYYDGRQYDVIVCSHILEHVDLPALFLRNMRSLLKDNGRLFLAVPNGHGCFECENKIPTLLGRTRWGKGIIQRMMAKKVKDTLGDSPHVQFFTAKHILGLLNENGFKIEKRYNEQLIGGPISDRTVLRLPGAEKLNLILGRLAPSWAANGWIFICRK